MYRPRVFSGVLFAGLFSLALLASALAAASSTSPERAPPDRVNSGTISFEQSSVTANITGSPETVTLNGIVSISMTPQVRSVTVRLTIDESGGLEATLSPDTMTFTSSGDEPFTVAVLVPGNSTEPEQFSITVSGVYQSSPSVLGYRMSPATAMIEVQPSGDDTNTTTTKKKPSSGGFFAFLGDLCCCIVLLPVVVVLLIVLLIIWLIRRKKKAVGIATTVAAATGAAAPEKKGLFDGLRDRIKDRRASLPRPGANLGAHRPAASVSRPSAPTLGANRPAASVSRPSVGGGAKGGGLLGKRGR